MKDYYYILGVKPNVTTSEIKSAYRKLAKKFHPDKNDGDTFFEERFKEIQEAHETLIDPSTRQEYDNSRNPNESPTPPVILSFSINKTALSSAEEFTVSWQTLHAETVTIQPFNIEVDANGNKSFRIPKLDAKLETIKIELIAHNRFGNVARTVVLKNLEWETPIKAQDSLQEATVPEEKENWLYGLIGVVVIGLALWGLVSGGIFIYDKVVENQKKLVFEQNTIDLINQCDTLETITDEEGNYIHVEMLDSAQESFNYHLNRVGDINNGKDSFDDSAEISNELLTGKQLFGRIDRYLDKVKYAELRKRLIIYLGNDVFDVTRISRFGVGGFSSLELAKTSDKKILIVCGEWN